MEENNNIDKIFRTAASAYSAPTPSGAWDRMQSALAAKRRRKALFWWLFSAGILVIISIASFIWVVDNSFIKSIVVEKQEIGDIPIAIEEHKTINGKHKTTNNNKQQTSRKLSGQQQTTNIPITIGATTNNEQQQTTNKK